jgi:hypothetical protein
MAALLRTPATAIWFALIIATAVSWALGAHHGVGATLASVAVILVAGFKARCIGLYFMELREAPTMLRGIFEAYVGIVTTGLLVIYVTV